MKSGTSREVSRLGLAGSDESPRRGFFLTRGACHGYLVLFLPRLFDIRGCRGRFTRWYRCHVVAVAAMSP